MPKIAEIEFTPNPDARKFVLKEPLTFGVVRSYESAAEASVDDLSTRLFKIPHVINVFYVDNWVTVTQDGEADWSELQREIAVPIREASAAKDETEQVQKAAEWLDEDESLSETDKEKLEQIKEILDIEVRPYLQGDGGDLYIVGLIDNILQVHYQGACGSCPSSMSGTLAGIQSLVNRVDPNLEVVAV
mgnify:CR=1 FL=1